MTVRPNVVNDNEWKTLSAKICSGKFRYLHENAIMRGILLQIESNQIEQTVNNELTKMVFLLHLLSFSLIILSPIRFASATKAYTICVPFKEWAVHVNSWALTNLTHFYCRLMMTETGKKQHVDGIYCNLKRAWLIVTNDICLHVNTYGHNDTRVSKYVKSIVIFTL